MPRSGGLCHTGPMSDTKTIKNPSPLVLAVLKLDEHFSSLKRLADRIDEVELKSNFDFEQSERLITHFAETGQAISDDIVEFVNVLNDARAQAESAAQRVAVKADLLKERKDDVQTKMARFQDLNEKVSKLNESLMQFSRPAGETLTDQDKEELKARLAEIGSQLQELIDEADVLKGLGHSSKIKTLEQNAESMRQSLIAVKRKIQETTVVQ